jgi:hypothetical protein
MLILRALWRQRIMVAVGAVLAIAFAVKAMGGAAASTGSAETRVVLDTPRSQLIDSAPAGADTLPWRATLLADLLGTAPSRRQIAGAARVPLAQLGVVAPDLLAPAVPASLPVAASDAAAPTPETYVVSAYADGVLPIISVTAQAPDRAASARLVQAAVGALQASAAPPTDHKLQGLIVRRVDPIKTHTIAGGHGRKKALIVAVVLFFAWCTAVAFAPTGRKILARAAVQ